MNEAQVMNDAQDPVLSPLIEAEDGGWLQGIIRRVRTRSRLQRSALFHSLFDLNENTRILDLGGANGVHIHALLSGTAVQPKNVFIADIDADAVHSAAAHFGYTPVLLAEDGMLPFVDAWFDVVLCSSVLEHVTIPKEEIWLERSGPNFKRRARAQQHVFAQELARVSRGYFVQVPNRWFPIETHTWLPFVGYMPRPWQCRVIAVSNRIWIKKTDPDFYLPTAADMREYFPTAELMTEKFFGLTKSLIAVKRSPVPERSR